MQTVTRGQRIFFGAVGLLALWVGTWGYFIPQSVDTAIPWLVPPLHARFLGAMYLSGLTFMIGGILSRYYAQVRVMVAALAIWTGMLFVVSLLYLDEFDYTRPQVWIWFGAYLVYPLLAIGVLWQHRGVREDVPGVRLPAWVRDYLLGQGLVVTGLALALLLAPSQMSTRWPWAITPLLAQLYAAPFLAYGLSSLLSSRQQTWAEIRVVVTSTFVFALGVLLASVIHRPLFAPGALSTWIWFGGFALAAAALALLSLQASRAGTTTP